MEKKIKNTRVLIGKKLSSTNTKFISIIEDSYVDMQGSGALKITQTYDFNDFKIGKKLKISFSIIFDKYGKLNKNVPVKYQGLDRLKAEENNSQGP